MTIGRVSLRREQDCLDHMRGAVQSLAAHRPELPLSASPVLAGISYELLNAKPENVQREAEIVAQSGRQGSVTISTNMAGRGTDILLGGNPEYMARVGLSHPAVQMPLAPARDILLGACQRAERALQ